jgi:hypothetical protein
MANFKLLGRNGKMAARVFNFQKYKPLQVLQEQAPVQIVMGGIGGGGFGGGYGGGYGAANPCCSCPSGSKAGISPYGECGCHYTNGNWDSCIDAPQ